MKLVVITSSKRDDDEVIAIIKMMEAGLETVHVRKPRFTTKELSDYIKSIPEHFHNRLIIHSHHNLARKFDLKGIHYTGVHLKKPFKIWWNNKLLGLKSNKLIHTMSYRRVSDVYKKEKIETDYCFLGTLFHNITGGLYSGFYEETVMAVNQKSGRKIIARGGVNEKSVESAYKLGFYGIALYGYLWKSANPYGRYLEFLKLCREKNIPIE